MKPVSFIGDSLDRIRALPEDARREAGFQLDRLQRGLDPDHWKPMTIIGQGVREIRIVGRAGAFRVIYAATFGDVVYVLHAFPKKSQATARREMDIAASRFRELRMGS
jgi:phage-related protein